MSSSSTWGVSRDCQRELGYSQDKVVLCGMAIGYEDKSAIVNSYRTPREELDKIVRYFP